LKVEDEEFVLMLNEDLNYKLEVV